MIRREYGPAIVPVCRDFEGASEAQIQEIGLFARSRRAFVVVLHEDGEGEGRPRQVAGTGGGEGVAAELAAAM